MGAPGTPAWPRSLGVGSVLDATFSLYRRHALVFMLAVAVVSIPLAVADHLLKVSLGIVPDTRIGAADPPMQPDVGQLAGESVVGFFSNAILLLGDTLYGGAVTLLGSWAILGQSVGVREAYRRVLGRAWTVIAASTLVVVVWLALFVTIVGIPWAVRFALRWSLVVPVLLLEGGGVMDGLRRSRELTYGHLWRLLGLFLAVLLLGEVLTSAPSYGTWYVLEWLVELGGGGRILTAFAEATIMLVNAALRTAFGSLVPIATTVAYYSARVHDEGLDLQQRAAALGGEPGELA